MLSPSTAAAAAGAPSAGYPATQHELLQALSLPSLPKQHPNTQLFTRQGWQGGHRDPNSPKKLPPEDPTLPTQAAVTMNPARVSQAGKQDGGRK